MKNKQMLFGFLAILFLIPAFILLFLNIFGVTIGELLVGELGLFPENGGGDAIWITLNSVFAVITAVVALIYIALFVASNASKKLAGKLEGITKLVALILTVVAIVTVALGVVGMLVNTETFAGVTSAVVPAIGFWLQISAIVGGVLAFMAAKK